MVVCLICGKYEKFGLEEAMEKQWIFTRCPECHRGFPLDILAVHLQKSIPEKYFEGFCPKHWFKDSGICAYCKIRREEMSPSITS